MRIISGKYKSKRLMAPKNLPVRPTTDMAKEGLFNVLNNFYYFQDVKVLDLFSGTGNIAYEFGSRGTESILCVDQNYNCIRYINQTAKELDLPIDTVKSDVFSFLERHQQSYDIVFADPPYDLDQESFEKIKTLVFEKELIGEEGLLVIEHSENTDLSHLEHFSQSRRYGGCYFSFFELLD